MLLQISSAEFRYADTIIFSDVNLDVNEGDNIGLVGANGAGKSTLLSCITGEKQLFGGNIYKKNGLTIGVLKQNCDFVSDNTLFAELLSVFAEQHKLVEEIKRVSDQMATLDYGSEEYLRLSERYHKLTVQADVSEAYMTEQKVKTVLSGMGMTEFADRVVSTLSGGEKTKAALCKLLLLRPELLILDEPTNHLDYKTLDWLENFLSDKKSTLIVVSHDRYFLDKLCTTIWDIQHKKVTAYKGNYTKYKQLKRERIELQQKEYDRQQKEIEKLKDYIARNKVRASTADMAKSREKMLERMDVVDSPLPDEQPPRFRFSYTTEPSEYPLTVKDFSVAFGQKQVLSHLDLQVRRGQKVALLGLNGTGKSTLIRRIAAQSPADYAHITFGKNVRMGYYDQENLNLDGNLRVLDQLWFDNTRMAQTDVRKLLAQVTLGADDVYKLVSELSGGERAKLGLAMIMAKDNNMLLLDEPTNHLDLPSREALEEALKAYTGTVLFVSHDRYFVNAVSSQIAELNDGAVTVYDGNYDDFVQRVNSPKPTGETPKPTTNNTQKGGYRSAKQRAAEVNTARKVKEAEARITELEEEINSLNEQLTLTEVASDYKKVAEITARLNAANEELEEAMSLWETLQQ